MRYFVAVHNPYYLLFGSNAKWNFRKCLSDFTEFIYCHLLRVSESDFCSRKRSSCLWTFRDQHATVLFGSIAMMIILDSLEGAWSLWDNEDRRFIEMNFASALYLAITRRRRLDQRGTTFIRFRYPMVNPSNIDNSVWTRTHVPSRRQTRASFSLLIEQHGNSYVITRVKL